MNLHCTEHNTAWFKRGNMRGYAHPIPSGGWCNMPESTGQDASPPPTIYTAEGDQPWTPPVDPTRISIERQVALKAAVEYSGYMIKTDKAFTTGQVVITAARFYDWLQGKEAAKPSTTGPDGQDIADL